MANKPRINLSSLVGRLYGQLMIIDAYRNHRSYIVVEARCTCGNKWKGYLNNLQNGDTKSCGCIGKERTKNAISKNKPAKTYSNA